MSTNPALILNDPEIKKYFLSILQSNLSDDEKYKRFIDFFELESQIKSELLSAHGNQLLTIDANKIGEIVSAAGQTVGIWKPDEIVDQTCDSIRRALQRLKNSQHRDGGWGTQVEISNPWSTAYAVLCLSASKQVDNLNISIEENLEKGSRWLRERSAEWSVENIDVYGSRSVYDVSVVIRACYETGQVDFPSLDLSRRKLMESQNKDGGWDARLWPDHHPGPSRVFSEVGATSTALRTLAVMKRNGPVRPSHTSFVNALEWFLRTQNEDGSWNNKSCTPASPQVEGDPSITKTCDGIKGILIAKASLFELDDATVAAGSQAVEKAVNWLLRKEQPLYDWSGNISGWGWGAETIGEQKIADMDNTLLTMETLVQIESESISLPLLTANAQWLMKQQYKPAADEDTIEDGKWEPSGPTARIALSLIEFYKRIEGSPLFAKVSQPETTKQVDED